ncbi:MAG TPA: DUF423 domain-containing protein [Devosia sp.]|nr:DUF423 domain-containing protein [Devosia sp.]
MIDTARLNRPLFTLAGLIGALGVAAAARGQHGGEADLSIAANMLLLHAPALLVLSLIAGRRLLQLAAYVLLAGLVLFAGDLAMRAELGHALFPLAAPLGGIGLIVGWLGVAVGAWVR